MRSGVFVLLAGDLGSHHTALDTDTFRGFALADPIAPFVAINGNDARVAWSFTLLHELTHILLGQTGISGGPPVQSVELLCNDVASEYLLPAGELRQQLWNDASLIGPISNQIGDFPRERNLSRQMAAYRLFRAGVLTSEIWQELRAQFRVGGAKRALRCYHRAIEAVLPTSKQEGSRYMHRSWYPFCSHVRLDQRTGLPNELVSSLVQAMVQSARVPVVP